MGPGAIPVLRAVTSTSMLATSPPLAAIISLFLARIMLSRNGERLVKSSMHWPVRSPASLSMPGTCSFSSALSATLSLMLTNSTSSLSFLRSCRIWDALTLFMRTRATTLYLEGSSLSWACILAFLGG